MAARVKHAVPAETTAQLKVRDRVTGGVRTRVNGRGRDGLGEYSSKANTYPVKTRLYRLDKITNPMPSGPDGVSDKHPGYHGLKMRAPAEYVSRPHYAKHS